MADHVKSRRYDSTRREAKAALTREKVLEAALALFTTHGYASTTGRDIASAAGVSLDVAPRRPRRCPPASPPSAESALRASTPLMRF